MSPDREQILAFRLASHNLSRKLPARALLEAAGACGIEETPSGSAAIALLARVADLQPMELERALNEDRSLVATWAMRGAPWVVPARDLWVFTKGALPRDRASFKHSLGGWSPALEEAGLDPFDSLRRMTAAAEVLLDQRVINVNELRDRIYKRVRSLSRVKRPEFSRADMPEPLFRALGTVGAVCIVSGRGTDAELTRTDQWLRPFPAEMDGAEARAELARRFLHCYGPTTARSFAEWTQRSNADAKQALDSIDAHLVEVTLGRTKALLLASDEKGLASPSQPAGVKLLPQADPYLQQRDRPTLLPEQAHRRKLWQATRGPGGVLVDGEIAGVWRANISGTRLAVTVEPFGRVSRGGRAAIEAEAERMAAFRSCAAVAVEFLARSSAPRRARAGRC